MPVRERLIPKANGKLRMLGIATARDRVVQASLKLVIEPIFEAEFHSCSYGFRPKRRAQDAIAEIHFLTSRSYEWVLEADSNGNSKVVACPGLFGTWPLIDNCRGYACIFFVKNLQVNERKEVYSDLKKTIDDIIPSSCK